MAAAFAYDKNINNKNIFFIKIGNTIIYNSLMKNNYSFKIYEKDYENINK